MFPRPDEQFLGRLQPIEVIERVLDVEILPAADGISWRGDTLDTNRSFGPARGVIGVLVPFERPGLERVQALCPELRQPAIGVIGQWRRQVMANHPRAPIAVRPETAPAVAELEETEIVVRGRMHGADRLQVRRALRRGFERSDAAVRCAPHADVAVAPRLLRDPLDRVVPVAPFLRIERDVVDPFGAAEATEVDDHRCIAAPGEMPVYLIGIAAAGAAVFVVRDIVHDAGKRTVPRRLVEIAGEPHAVAHGDEHVANDFNRGVFLLVHESRRLSLIGGIGFLFQSPALPENNHPLDKFFGNTGESDAVLRDLLCTNLRERHEYAKEDYAINAQHD